MLYQTSKELLIKNPLAAFTVWYGVDNDAIEYVNTVKKSKHNQLMLFVLQNKDDFVNIGKIIEKCRWHHDIVLQYQDTHKIGLRPIAQTAILVSNKDYTLDPTSCSWFNKDIGYPTNLWDLSPNDNSDVIGLKEDRKFIPFGQASVDVFILLQQLSKPLPVLKWNYVGPKNPSVELYAKKVLDCNAVFE